MKPTCYTFPTACSEEHLVTDGTTDIHWQKYLMESIFASYLVTVAALIVCFASAIVRLPKVSEWDWEQSPAKEKMPTAVLQLSQAEGSL